MQRAPFDMASVAVQPQRPTSRDALAMPRFCTRVVPRRFLRDTWESWSYDASPMKSAHRSMLIRDAGFNEHFALIHASRLWLSAHPARVLHTVLAAAPLLKHGG